jgi:hypothetical protein
MTKELLSPTALAEYYRDGWSTLTQRLRDKQLQHLDKHEGDVYHTAQWLASKYGLHDHGPLTQSLDAPPLPDTNHPAHEEDALGYYRAMAIMGTAASYILENEVVMENEPGRAHFHKWLALWETMVHIPERIQRLFMEGRLLVTFIPAEVPEGNAGKLASQEYTCTFHVLCSDLFYWATADAEAISWEEYPDLLKAFDESPKNGELLWCCRKRKLRPQWGMYKYFTPEERNLFNAAGPVREDHDGKHH